MKMAKHNPGEDQGTEPPELSRSAFLKSLLHVEGDGTNTKMYIPWLYDVIV